MFLKISENNRKKVLAIFLGCLAFGLSGLPRSRAYVLPPEQLVEFMAVNFNSLDTLVIDQITQQENPSDREIGEDRIFREKLLIQASGNYRLEILEQTAEKLEGAEHLFRQFLMTSPKDKLLQLLPRLGIDLHQVFYDRLNGAVVYRIGDKNENSPKLLIEKKRFLPLLLVYPLPGDPRGKTARVHFKDYRAVKDKWYPYDITYAIAGQLSERYLIQNLETGISPDPALKTPKTAAPAPAKQLTPEEKQRLKKIIEAFEKKYQ